MSQLPQNQLDQVLKLLKLPQDMEVFTGQVNKCTRYSLVENRLIDRTNVENFKLKPKTTSTFTSVPKTIDLGAYNHNLLSAYIHSYGYDAVGLIGNEYRLDKDGLTFTHPTNGLVYTIGWGEVAITPTVDGFDMRLEYEPWMNTNADGTPATTAKLSITRITTSKIGTVRIIPSQQLVNITNVRTATSKDYPSYTQAELEEKTGWNEYQIAEACATVFHFKTKDVNTHCVALGTDIEIENNTLTGVVYINGTASNEINFKELTSSYGKKLPDFVTRWKVYNATSTSGSVAYGTALPVIQNASFENNSIQIVKGDDLAYNSTTKTLTYTDGTTLVFDFEFLPAQGKNEGWGSKLDLDTMTEDIFS